jgi:two-component system cell cycle response regulator
MDRRAVLGVSAGLAGLIVGVAGAIAGVAWLAALAGVAALAAGAATWWLASDQARPRAAAPVVDVTAIATNGGGRPRVPTAGEIDRESARDALLTDADTGLFSEGYFRVALDARVSAARRHLRPVSVVILDVVEALGSGTPLAPDAHAVSAGITATVRDADTACRLADGRYALVLEDTPENGAIWTVERVRRRLVLENADITLWAGVACYPAHAFTPEAVLDQAERALEAAREWRQDRIEVALAP